MATNPQLLRPMPVSRRSVEVPVVRALVVGEPDEQRNTLKHDLQRVGVHVLGATDCQQMVQEAIRLDPQIVVVWAPLAGQPLFAATTQLESVHPVAIAVFTEDTQLETMERAVESGIHAWILHGYRADRLRPVLQLAQVRFRHERKARASRASLAPCADAELAARPRCLAQRAAGLGLFDRPASERDAIAAAGLTRDFEAALAAMRETVLATAEERQLLDDAREAWNRLLSCAGAPAAVPPSRPCDADRDKLLAACDRLAEHCANRVGRPAG